MTYSVDSYMLLGLHAYICGFAWENNKKWLFNLLGIAGKSEVIRTVFDMVLVTLSELPALIFRN